MIGRVVSIYAGVEVILPIISLFSNEFDEHVLDGPIEPFNKSLAFYKKLLHSHIAELQDSRVK